MLMNMDDTGSESDDSGECLNGNDINCDDVVVRSLSDLAAQVTGKHYTCKSLENHHPPLDESLIKKVAFWAFPQSENHVKVYAKLTHDKFDHWGNGKTLVKEKRIMEIAQVGFMISAIISKPQYWNSEEVDPICISFTKKEGAKVSLSFEKQQVTSVTCSACSPQLIWCRHIIAVIIYRIHNADKIAVHGPVTDVLCTLDRNQIQKLLQYAILEDPGGMTCRIFKYMDLIRNPRSELNETQGAPDPTFGISSDQKSVKDLSLGQLTKDFKEDLQKASDTGIKYPDTCDLLRKAKSEIYVHYIHKVLQLVWSDDLDSARNVLIMLANNTCTEIRLQGYLKNMIRLFHDLDRLFTCFIVSFKGQIRKDVIKAAYGLNSIARKMGNADIVLTACDWSDLDSMPLENCLSATQDQLSYHDNKSEGIFGASREMPFYQALCASRLPRVPVSLGELFCGKQKPLTTSYEEKLPVMLLRFEALTQFEMKERDKKLYNLGVVILKKLLNLSLKFSVIGCNKFLESSNQESDESENEAVTKGTSRKRTYKQKTRPRKKPCSIPRLETTEVDMEGMSKAQVSYSLLFVCYTLYQIDNLVSLGREGISVIFDATFRALELGRFRAIAPQGAISVDGYRWLEFLDKRIQESYLKIGEKNSALHTLQEQMIQKYTSALQEHQTSFYGDHYPLGLLSFLLKDSLVSDKVGQMLSLGAVCLSNCPVKNLTIPERQDDHSHIDDVKSRWRIALKRVFSGHSGDKVNNTVISKFLTFTESIDDHGYAVLVYDVLSDFQKEFTLHEQRISCMKFLLRFIKLCNSCGYTRVTNMLCTSLEEIGQLIQPDFLGLILPNWQELLVFFSMEKLTEIIKVMKVYIKTGGNLPRETIDLILNYFEAPFKHDKECKQFLKLFHDAALKEEALGKVITNRENYTVTALLLLAKNCHQEMDPSTLPVGCIFSKTVFMVLQEALKKIRESNVDTGGEVETPFSVELQGHLLWFFEKIADCKKSGNYGNKKVTGSQLCAVTEDIATTIKNNSKMIVSFLRKMEKSKPLFNHVKQLTGEQLINIYRRKFERRLQTCTRRAYEDVLKDMKAAQSQCIQYVDSGSSLFKKQVTDAIRKSHRGKKKFFQMMEDKFPELKQDI